MEQTRDRLITIIRDLPFFDSFTQEEVDEFARNMSLQHIEEGAVLFREGDVGDYLFFIIEGVMEILLENGMHRQKIIATYSTGASVGEMALIDEFERSATVRATTDCEILVLTKSKFESILKAQPSIGVKLLKGLAKNISMRLRKSHLPYRDLA